MKSFKQLVGSTASVIALAVAAPAFAQAAGADTATDAAEPDVTDAAETVTGQAATASEPAQAVPAGESTIVVTGTLIRGVAPTGSPVLSLSEKDITATGAANSSQVLARLPQVTSFFNATPSPGGGPLTTIARPDIRRLNASAGGCGA